MSSPTAVPVEAVVLADVAIVLAVGALLVHLARRLRQPPVVAEIAAGLVLGPSVLGLLPGDLPARIFPADARTPLSAVAQLGLALFMFIAGWELDLRRIRGSGRTLGCVAALSMAVPFAMGAGLAALLYGGQAPHGVPRHVFVLYLATAFSITAFPVLARIVRDQGLSRSRVGSLAMACAAVCDVVAWCVLVLVTSVAGGGRGGGFLTTTGLTVAFGAVMALVVRPLLKPVVGRLGGRADHGVLVVFVVSGVLLSAWVTSWIGVHAIFGAFAFGLVMPRQYADTHRLVPRVAVPVERAAALLLPVYFVITGLSVDITHLGVTGLGVLLAALAVAVLGKLAGTALPLRLSGAGRRESAVFGTLMNARGLTELVVLGIGLQLGLITANLFTVMVLVALLTTAMTGPLLRLLGVKDTNGPEHYEDTEGAEGPGGSAALGIPPVPGASVPAPARHPAARDEPLDAQPV